MYGPNGDLDILNESSVVQANQPALARFREGLGKECGTPFNPSFDAKFESLAKFRSLARLLGAEADVYAAGGNTGRAAMSALDAIQLGTDVERGGPLISGLVVIAIQRIGQSALQRRGETLSRKDSEKVDN